MLRDTDGTTNRTVVTGQVVRRIMDFPALVTKLQLEGGRVGPPSMRVTGASPRVTGASPRAGTTRSTPHIPENEVLETGEDVGAGPLLGVGRQPEEQPRGKEVD